MHFENHVSNSYQVRHDIENIWKTNTIRLRFIEIDSIENVYFRKTHYDNDRVTVLKAVVNKPTGENVSFFNLTDVCTLNSVSDRFF